VRELWPKPAESIDIAARLRSDPRPAPPGRPWVTMVMIASLDGGIEIDGLSGGLGNDADKQRFIASRRTADTIVVGSRTAMVENYRPATVPIAILSRSLDLDRSARIFSDPDRKPLLYTTDQAARTKGPDFDGIAELRALGDSVDPAAVLADLAGRGSEHVALEGGPTLNGHFLEADVVDEILLSVAPVVVSGAASRLAHGSVALHHRFDLDRVLIDEGYVFVRYLRAEGA